ncbi:MAG: hypothetical protein ACYDH8_10205 [Syntrophales bacterium]
MSIAEKIFKKMGSFLTGEKIDGRRNNFYVEKDFQKRFILFFLVIISLLIIVSGVASFIMLRGFFEESMYYIHPNFKGITEMATFKLILFFVEFSVIFFIIIIIAADIMMRRIAKELMSYERIADRLAALDFRKAAAIADAKLFSRLHRQYMYLIDKYSTDVSLLKEKLTRMQVLIALLGDGDMPEEKKNMATTELFELHNAVKAKMAEYKLDNCR